MICFSESIDTHKGVEFDFLIGSEFLRVSLIEHISEKGISTENVIDVEYILKHPPPEPQDCLIHDDWVSTVAVCEKWLVLLEILQLELPSGNELFLGY